ncbi:MAG: response regulator, partial [Lachnospiraceae bacterium]|nr:response regulator [Lachnospiraceae bacterium]
MKVLVVEDDSMILEGLKYSLMQESYEVTAVGTVKEAMDRIHDREHFDICLLDIMLPDGNGYEICREIRKESQVPILFLTACDDEVNTVMALEQ